ncbi:MAG TPA: dTDP-4-dehydrorhamnose reductase [Candidatus Acidoferrales bacterium]|nr:dTDP-4-dehydrorhamnose reductase [Candidatus Acidoferrales bacterium]
MRIAVIGAKGQVGSEIVAAANAHGIETLALSHETIEVTDQRSVERALEGLRTGDLVVNAAAFHRTDACEDEPDRALSINTVAAYRVALEAHKHGASVAYISSDFVFDGGKREPYVESDAPHPLNVYGMTKLAGEFLVSTANLANYIVRISAVFGVAGSSGKGGNFVETMVAKARAGEAPKVVDDIVMVPTSARDAAELMVQLALRRAPYGIYHLANAGQCSWYEFAQTILASVGSKVRPEAISAAETKGKAARPAYSVLASERLAPIGIATRSWKLALDEYLRAKGYV